MRPAHLWGTLGAVVALGAAAIDIAPAVAVSAALPPLYLIAGLTALLAGWRNSARWASIAMVLMIACGVLGVALIARLPAADVSAITMAPPVLAAVGAACCLGMMLTVREDLPQTDHS